MSRETRPVRVRFAPSPTGHLHIGGLRTAIFNWLFARHHGGTFLVRIEDTDIERSKKEYTDAIMQALDWMHLQPDEPITMQSDRFAEHKTLIDELLARGLAYKDYYTQDELYQKHEEQFGTAEFAKAYRVCRDQAQEQDKPYVIRFKLPLERKELCFDDAIRGRVCFAMEQLDDFVLNRPDGRPMYNFVVVADDIHQGITHVIRGEDHISNTPKQLLLYEALGATPPIFAHLPLILGSEGQRLSKRDAAASVMDYKSGGYLPDALFNYLVRLGWSHGDQEVFNRKELIDIFSLDAVGKKGAIFDMEKLDWLNGMYMRNTDDLLLYHALNDAGLLPAAMPFSQEQLIRLIGLYKERAKTLKELIDQIMALAEQPEVYDQASLDKWTDPATPALLKKMGAILQDVDPFSDTQIKAAIMAIAKENGKKLGALAQPVRIALVGGSSSPSIFELVAILGKHMSLARLHALENYLLQRA